MNNKPRKLKDYTIIENNTPTIRRYSNWLHNNVSSKETIKNKIIVLHPFFRFVDYKLAEEITKDDVESYFAFLRETKNVNTINQYKIQLRFFFKWLKPENNFFSDISTKQKLKDINFEELITEDEVKQIIQMTRNSRDRAFLHVLYDSAARLGELVKLKYTDVKIDQWGGKITVNGKTGERTIRIVDSVPDLQTWMNQHCGEGYLFYADTQKKALSRNGARSILLAAKNKAGIKKRIYPHLFRHSKITKMYIAGMTESRLKPYAGWKKTSQMASIYIHLAESNIDEKVLEIYGIKKEKKIEIKSTIHVCPFCKTKNTFDATYCINCSRILDQTKVIDPMQEKMNSLEEKIKNLERNVNKDGDLSLFF